MKYDDYGCLIREKYSDSDGVRFYVGNRGDSCAESSRAVILGDDRPNTLCFADNIGYLRHPILRDVDGWNHADFSNDQFLPLIMAFILRNGEAPRPSLFIRGTKTVVSIGVMALMLKQYWLLNIANIIQGWLFNLKWRWFDSDALKGKLWKFERSDGQVQDWLNYICTYVLLKRLGKWATLNQPKERCMAAVRKYYLEGPDAEPNAEWIVDLYEKNLKPGTQPVESLR